MVYLALRKEQAMNEAEWLDTLRPGRMLRFLRGMAGDRKLRLFSYACWQRLRHLVISPRLRWFLALLEPFADGLANHEELRKAQGIEGQFELPDLGREGTREYLTALRLSQWGAHPNAWRAARQAARTGHEVAARIGDWAAAAEVKAQCQLLRELFGNPFRNARVDPAWLQWQGGVVAGLCQAAYEQRKSASVNLDNDRLAVLADALEEAGCDDADILGHLRSGGEHLRGCFVLDLLLDKS
jgi:hypothetical protein